MSKLNQESPSDEPKKSEREDVNTNTNNDKTPRYELHVLSDKRVQAALKILVTHLIKHSPSLKAKLTGIIEASPEDAL